ncbi:MAG: metallophosphoesterase [Lentisphaeria bacterium]|nr:metallophosphoesterase [Lentisphaeria bacterium]
MPGKRWALKIALSVLVLIAAFKFQILHIFGGPMYFAPVLPRWVLLSGAILFTIHFIYFFLLGFSEAIQIFIRLAAGLLRRKLPAKFYTVRQWINPVLLIPAAAIAVIGIYNGIRVPDVKEVKLTLNQLPEKAIGMRIVFLSDLHIDRMRDTRWLPQTVEKVNVLKPDMILLGGDLMDGKVADLKEKMLPISKLQAPMGVYGVPGNHEYYSGFNEWMKFLSEECKIKMLINTACRPGRDIVLMGVADHAGKKFGNPRANFRQAFKDVALNDRVILLAHRPDLAKEAENLDIMLQISGHTHGGMLWGLDKIVAKLNGGFVSGHYVRSNTHIYVSNGTGIWSGFPVRLTAPAEITLITLERN